MQYPGRFVLGTLSLEVPDEIAWINDHVNAAYACMLFAFAIVP